MVFKKRGSSLQTGRMRHWPWVCWFLITIIDGSTLDVLTSTSEFGPPGTTQGIWLLIYPTNPAINLRVSLLYSPTMVGFIPLIWVPLYRVNYTNYGQVKPWILALSDRSAIKTWQGKKSWRIYMWCWNLNSWTFMCISKHLYTYVYIYIDICIHTYMFTCVLVYI